jgi:polyhydroxybutyrate depolymerase
LYGGGQCGKHQIFKGDGWACSSVQDYISTWRRTNKCPTESSITYQNGDAICETYSPCDKNTEVTLCTIDGGGHTWPGGQLTNTQKWWTDIVGIVSQDISANDAMWEFFERHPME